MTELEHWTQVRDYAQARIDALNAKPEKPTLAPKGEWSPSWLRVLNNAYQNKFPSGYTGDIVDPNAGTRVPVVLAGSLLWGDVPADRDATQAAELQRWCNVVAWGIQAFTLIRNPDGVARITPVYREGVPPGPGEYTLALARGLWPTEADVEAAVVDLYERTFGPL